ncbi:hypothetical protein BCR41DRAFT_354150 [Lobosporangium transversale]|uniref:Uncharacterized protein n=1 Tax=Lobosporangium transversale TaxID=64571 RepID=A0A1Y2GLI3_9FUNG|nr:hypothetical protein BCR41DRAFT_354150 [Lobosporangium transversale]ORZ14815.1 hypothetical protein BCR41DRAFT_354150 [Lobosporangium transversale]|eukprot:XP_021880947.1 hypothetical protein BCR41DRAFT_354150 [Lobosporangium transversale]
MGKFQRSKATARSTGGSAPTYTVNDLLAQANQAVDRFEFELAHQFAMRALSMEPKNVNALEAAGSIEVELELFNEAKEHFLECVRLQPDTGYSKFMYLGQMSEQLEAISYFQQGVNLMIDERAKMPVDITKGSDYLKLSSKISSALCSMTDIYLTDCCFEPDAESQCEAYLAQAMQIEPVTPEVYQTLASVRLSQQRGDEAKVALAQGLALWLGSDPTDEDGPTPDYETRLALVKLLLETAMYDEAFTVLNGLIEENDQVPDTLYLFGWANYIAAEEVDPESPNADEEKKEQLENAREALNACTKLWHATGSTDEPLLQHTQELLETITNLIGPEIEQEEPEGGEIEYNEDEDEEMA